jgi:FtsZ-binding cell division protein ZapB
MCAMYRHRVNVALLATKGRAMSADTPKCGCVMHKPWPHDLQPDCYQGHADSAVETPTEDERCGAKLDPTYVPFGERLTCGNRKPCAEHAVEAPTEPMGELADQVAGDRIGIAFQVAQNRKVMGLPDAAPLTEPMFSVAAFVKREGGNYQPNEQGIDGKLGRALAQWRGAEQSIELLEQRIKELEGESGGGFAGLRIKELLRKLTEAETRIRTLEEKLTAVQDGSFCTKCGWRGVPVPAHAGFAKFDWQCGNPKCGYMVDPPKSAIIERLQSALTAAEKERTSLRVRMFGLGRVKGSSHSTGCTIWGDNGMGGTPENFPAPPCNCGAIENFLRSSLHAAEEKIAELQKDWQAGEAGLSEAMTLLRDERNRLRDDYRELELHNLHVKAERDALRAEVEQLRGERDAWKVEANITLAKFDAAVERLTTAMKGS